MEGIYAENAPDIVTPLAAESAAMDGWTDGRMDGWTDGRMDGWMDGWTEGWMIGWLVGWLVGWMDGWMSGWMDSWMDGWMLPTGDHPCVINLKSPIILIIQKASVVERSLRCLCMQIEGDDCSDCRTLSFYVGVLSAASFSTYQMLPWLVLVCCLV